MATMVHGRHIPGRDTYLPTRVYPTYPHGIPTYPQGVHYPPTGIPRVYITHLRALPRVFYTHQGASQGVLYPPRCLSGCTLPTVMHLRVYITHRYAPQGVLYPGVYFRVCYTQVCTSGVVYTPLLTSGEWYIHRC